MKKEILEDEFNAAIRKLGWIQVVAILLFFLIHPLKTGIDLDIPQEIHIHLKNINKEPQFIEATKQRNLIRLEEIFSQSSETPQANYVLMQVAAMKSPTLGKRFAEKIPPKFPTSRMGQYWLEKSLYGKTISSTAKQTERWLPVFQFLDHPFNHLSLLVFWVTVAASLFVGGQLLGHCLHIKRIEASF